MTVFVGETRPNVGDVSVQRLWLGENFGPAHEVVPAIASMEREPVWVVSSRLREPNIQCLPSGDELHGSRAAAWLPIALIIVRR